MTQSDEGSRRKLPPDFPTEPVLGAVGGAQDKLLLCRRDDGRYGSQRRSPEEILHRFEVADDLVVQLVAYFKRKQTEFPEWTNEKNLERIRLALIQKAAVGKWPFSPDEQIWIMNRLRECCLGTFDLTPEPDQLKSESTDESKSQFSGNQRVPCLVVGTSIAMPTVADKILSIIRSRS